MTAQLIPGQDFANLEVFSEGEKNKPPLITISFWNTEAPTGWQRFMAGLIGFSGMAGFLGAFIYGIVGGKSVGGTAMVIGAALCAGMIAYGSFQVDRPRTVLRWIELDLAAGVLRVLRNKKVKFSHPLTLKNLTIEHHPEAEIEFRKLKGKQGLKQKQHCLFGWFGSAGANKQCLLCRFEWPNQESLIEVLKAILWSLEAGAAQHVAAGGKFGGRFVPAGDDDAARGGQRGGINPPLD